MAVLDQPRHTAGGDADTAHPDVPTSRRRSTRGPSWSRHGGVVQLLLAVAAFHVAVLLRDQLSASLVSIAFLLTVPGALGLRAIGIAPGGRGHAVLYTVATSVALNLAAVLGVTVVGALTSLARPLSTLPVVLAVDVMVLLLAAIAVLRRDAAPVPVPRTVSPLTALLLLPAAMAAGAMLIENRDQPWLAYVALVGAGAAVLWALRAARDGHDGVVAMILYCVTLTLLWSYSLRSSGLYGFDVQQEFAAFRNTADALRWAPAGGDPYGAMLSITALPTAWWQVTGLAPLAIFKALLPALFALYPIGVYLIARRWAGGVASLVATSVLFLTSSMAGQLPALARQEVGLLLFVVLVLVAFDRAVGRRQAMGLVVLLSAGLVVSHYSSAYVAILFLVLARVVAAVVALRCGRSRTSVLTLPIVALILVMSVVWTGPVTDSGNNVASFADRLSSNGLAILPNSGGSVLSSWLGGNTAAAATPRAYFDAAQSDYAEAYPWMADTHFSPGVQANFPAVESSPSNSGQVPIVNPGFEVVLVAVRQLANVGVILGALGMCVVAWRRRRAPDVLAPVVGMVGIAVLIRLSSSVAFSYNAERLAMQAAALFVVPLALGLGVLGRRLVHGRARAQRPARRPAPWRRGLAAAVAIGVVATVYLDASGLTVRAVKGDEAGNLSSRGEYAERYGVDAQDLAVARWVDQRRRDDSIIFTDRYGTLTLQYVGDRGSRGLFPDLAPGTLDTRAWVFASSSNITDGRARGNADGGLLQSTYEYPTGFLDTYKATIVDTGSARVYS
ncbi:hypothetical protein [Solicola sp. PLA-1-18]|uniref:hypothetical protein n=1 Tax=Solicola sp. PLA-1-18 TaxID=3380532 RepID=UPI003B7D32FB